MQSLLVNDIRTGTKKNIFKFCVAMLFAFVSCLYFSHRVEIYCSSHNMSGICVSGQDYILYLFGGMAEYSGEEDKKFDIPFIWMTVQMLACSCVFLYPVQDLHRRGIIFLLQSGSRTKWWISKCIWSVIQLFILYFCICAGIILAAGLSGGGWENVHTDFFRILEDVNILSRIRVGFGVVFYQILYSIAITMLQINISLVTNAVWGIICVTSYHILSVGIASELLLGNISMLYRMEGIAVTGQGIRTGLVGCILLMAVSVSLGLKYFKVCDVF